MKQWRGLWFPDTETHLIEWMQANQVIVGGRPAYQYAKYERALGLLPADRRRIAVDVGANIGLWSRVMLLDFLKVIAFEPVAAYRRCLELNAGEAEVHEVALGAGRGFVNLFNVTPGSCGDTRVEMNAEVRPTPMAPLDMYELPALDLLKIDCEGYEQFVCEGALETLRRCKPAVIVEQKPGHASKSYNLDDQGARKLLESIGMKVRAEMSGDFIMGW